MLALWLLGFTASSGIAEPAEQAPTLPEAGSPTIGPQQEFLCGMLAVRSREYRRAIGCFRSALILDPKSPRLRLELARAFYLADEYENAELQFRRALAGDLPPAVQANVRLFLERIRRERRWTRDLSLGLAPDTNINAGSSADQTILFGLPFQLGRDAKMRSGVGVLGRASVEFAPALGRDMRWVSGIAGRRSEYRGSQFDDTLISGWSGIRWYGRDMELSASATSSWRWYDGGLYQRSAGARLQGIFYRGAKTALVVGVAGLQFDYPRQPAQSGPVRSVTLGMVRVLDPTTSISVILNGAQQDARARDLSNRSALITISATRDFRGGFTFTVAPTFAVARYRAPDAFFGVTRSDRLAELRANVLYRKVVLWRLTPALTYVRSRRHSTIDLFRSHQDRLEIELTSAF